MAVDTRTEVADYRGLGESNTVCGILNGNKLYLTESGLVLSAIALRQMIGLKYVDDDIVTGIVAVPRDVDPLDDDKLATGLRIEEALNSYAQSGYLPRDTRFEYLSRLEPEAAVVLLGHAVDDVLEQQPGTYQAQVNA